MLREAVDQVQVLECDDYLHPRARRSDITIVDLDHAPIDTQKLLQKLRAQLNHFYLVVVGSATRIAAAVDDSADAELEASHADREALLAVIRHAPPRASSELARAHRLWAEVTPRQREVLRWLATGLDNPGIAHRMRVGDRAVKAHVSALLAHFACSNRTQLALLAQRAGLRPNGR